MNLYRVWCKFEPDHINAPAGRKGQWRVTFCSKLAIGPMIMRFGNELYIHSSKPYPIGSIIRPHKELNRVLALRRSLDGVDVIPPLAGSHPPAAVPLDDESLRLQPLNGFNIDSEIDTEMDDKQCVSARLGHKEIRHELETSAAMSGSDSLHFEAKG